MRRKAEVFAATKALREAEERAPKAVAPSPVLRTFPHRATTFTGGGFTGGRSYPTKYKGISFRGRNEARFAAALDRIGLRWIYEVDDITLGHETRMSSTPCTRPDFWIPAPRSYAIEFTELEGPTESRPGALETKQQNCHRLALALGRPVLLVRTYPFREPLANCAEVWWPDGSMTLGADAMTAELAGKFEAMPLLGLLRHGYAPQACTAFQDAYRTEFGRLDPYTGEPNARQLQRCLEAEQSEISAARGMTPEALQLYALYGRPTFSSHRTLEDWADSLEVEPTQIDQLFGLLVGLQWLAPIERPRARHT